MKNNRFLYILILIFLLPLTVYAASDPREQKHWEKCVELRQSDPDRALAELKRFRNRFPGSDKTADAIWYIAELTTDYYECVSTYMLFIEKFPGHPNVPEVHWRLAQRYYLHSNYSEAAKHLTAIIDRYQSSDYFADAHYWLGIIATERNQYIKAQDLFKFCIENNSDLSQWARLGLANNYYAQYDLGQAETEYLQVCREAKDREMIVIAVYRLAEIYFRQTNYSNALYCYDLAAENFPLSIEGENSKAQGRLIRSRHNSLRPVKPPGLSFAIDITDGGHTAVSPTMADNGQQQTVTAQTTDTAATIRHIESSSPSSAAIPTTGYSVQVGAFSTQRKAEELKTLLNTRSYNNVYIMEAQVNGQTWFRVRLGPFASHEEAERFAQRIKQTEHTDAHVVSN